MTGAGDRGPVTIADVARLAGVSRGTVSHVMSGRMPVAEATRARVHAAIRTLDYRPAESARSLTSRKHTGDGQSRREAALPRLTTVGYVSVDYTACLDRLPDREERRLAASILKTVGGPAANVAAVAAAVGGAWSVAASLITAIGIDQDSDWAAAELSARRVDLIVPRRRRDGRLARALVMVEADGARTIINEPSALAAVDVRQFVEATEVAGMPWCLHLEGYQVPGQIEALPLAKQRGFLTSMQATGLPPDWLARNIEAALTRFDLIVLHRESLALLPGCPAEPAAALRYLAALAPGDRERPAPALIALTLGEDGAAFVERSGRVACVPALTVPVTDRTGAGDAFVGALLAFWLNGADPEFAMRAACVAGSLAVTRFGAQEIRPSAAEIVRHLPPSLVPAEVAPAEPERTELSP